MLVVGAGPVGLTVALALAQAGVSVRVIDAGNEVDKRMRASTFHPPTLDMIDGLGLGDALIDIGLSVPRWQMRQHETGERVTFDLAAISTDTSHPYRLQCEQHRYCGLLLGALEQHGVPVDFNCRLENLEQDERAISAMLSRGGSVRAQWLIGADGAGSSVRQSLGVDYGGMTYEHTSVLVSTNFPFHEALDNLADVSYCWSQRGPFSLLRLRGLWRASLYPRVDDLDSAADESNVRDWLAFIHPDAHDADLVDIAPYRVHERCVDRFRHGRVLLAGDAAHLNPPSGGMGMNGGIHDAMNLAQSLAAVIAGEDTTLLDRYDRQRHHVASARVIPQASANRERMATMDPDVQLQRIAEYRAIAGDPARQRKFLLQSSMITGLREAAEIE